MSELRPLVICDGCGRHVRRDAAACPFCSRAGAAPRASLRGALVAAAFFGVSAIPGCAYGPPPDDLEDTTDGVGEVQNDASADLGDGSGDLADE